MPIAGIVFNESAIATDATHKAYARYYTTLCSEALERCRERSMTTPWRAQNDPASYDRTAGVVEPGHVPLRALHPVPSGITGNRWTLTLLGGLAVRRRLLPLDQHCR